MKKILIFLITVYQKTLSPDHGPLKTWGIITRPVCVFYPTCSDYAKEAISTHGVWKGTRLALRRISRCHPWQKYHHDPVPHSVDG